MSVSTIRNSSSGGVHLGARANTPKVKENDVWINNKKIRFSQDFAKTARSINRSYNQTGIKAEHVAKGKKENIVLTVRSSILTIKDSKGALAALYKAKQIGKGADKIIQIKRPDNGSVKLKYSTAAEARLPLLKGLVLNKANIVEFAGSRNILHPLQEIEIERERERGIALPIEEPDMVLEELGENNIPEQAPQEAESQYRVYTERELALREYNIQASFEKQRRDCCKHNSDLVVEKLLDKIGDLSGERQNCLSDTISTELFCSEIEEVVFKQHINEISSAIFDKINSKRGFFNKLFSNLGVSEKEVKDATQDVISLLNSSIVI